MTPFPTHVFREYDVRGLVATELTPSFAETLGRAYAAFLLEKNPAARALVLGRDHRLSSNGLAASFSRGARAYGLEVFNIGVVPTPLTYFAAQVLPVDGLCMITGSHNPPEYNGFKIGVGKSTMAGPEVQQVKERALAIHQGNLKAPASHPGRETDFQITDFYTSLIVQTLGPSISQAEGGLRRGQWNGRPGWTAAPARARARGDRAVLRARRDLSKPPPRSNRREEPGRFAERRPCSQGRFGDRLGWRRRSPGRG